LVLPGRYSKGFERFSKLDRTPAGKSDEPAGVIEIRTIDNIFKENLFIESIYSRDMV